MYQTPTLTFLSKCKGRLKSPGYGLFRRPFSYSSLFTVSRQGDEFNQHFFKNKAEHAQAQYQEQNRDAEFARLGFFAQVPDDKAQEDNQSGQADFHCPVRKFCFTHNRFPYLMLCVF
ncbi:hypothetical protein NEIMUCOT_04299 [Neisseria mucosa ATCC 25996]|uniref:Uncharacterized protein n=1 Tax=Neisseria mucosa (strain ATCC 25996 / DSM 4631 / NCTC 10774 / M26) TaxID=546266 RepID=D2ZUK9_NEIM2|nr:hypothetical protein NEIMUCOT_04299 [Neisseria mucosa ATCC 25996]